MSSFHFDSSDFLSIIDVIVDNSLSHLDEIREISHSMLTSFSLNIVRRMLSNFFSENISSSWNHP